MPLHNLVPRGPFRHALEKSGPRDHVVIPVADQKDCGLWSEIDLYIVKRKHVFLSVKSSNWSISVSNRQKNKDTLIWACKYYY